MKLYRGHPVDRRIRKMAQGILNRTKPKQQAGKNACYQGIECHLGQSLSEVVNFIDCNFRRTIETMLKEGIQPSIDRIDYSRHYSPDNVRVIPLTANTQAGLKHAQELNCIPVRAVYPDGVEETFDSIQDAAKHFGIAHTTITANARAGRHVQKGKAKGIYFELR